MFKFTDNFKLINSISNFIFLISVLLALLLVVFHYRMKLKTKPRDKTSYSNERETKSGEFLEKVQTPDEASQEEFCFGRINSTKIDIPLNDQNECKVHFRSYDTTRVDQMQQNNCPLATADNTTKNKDCKSKNKVSNIPLHQDSADFVEHYSDAFVSGKDEADVHRHTDLAACAAINSIFF